LQLSMAAPEMLREFRAPGRFCFVTVLGGCTIQSLWTLDFHVNPSLKRK
jgi:hypothetical protein